MSAGARVPKPVGRLAPVALTGPVDYVVPTGGGYFFCPRGPADASDWVGSGILS